MIDFEKTILLLKENHYVIVLLFVFEIVAILFLLKNYRKDYLGKLFATYLLFDLVITCIDIILYSIPSLKNSFNIKFVTITNLAIGAAEFFVYYSYFREIIKGKYIIKYLKTAPKIIFSAVLITTVLTINLPYKSIDYLANLIGVLELLLILPPCVLYFQELLNTESNLELFSRPSFWITAGVFFYSASAIPYYLIKKYLFAIDYAYKADVATAFYYTPILLNIFFLILAFRWKKTITT